MKTAIVKTKPSATARELLKRADALAKERRRMNDELLAVEVSLRAAAKALDASAELKAPPAQQRVVTKKARKAAVMKAATKKAAKKPAAKKIKKIAKPAPRKVEKPQRKAAKKAAALKPEIKNGAANPHLAAAAGM